MTITLNWDDLRKEFLIPKTQIFEDEINRSGFKIAFQESDRFEIDWFMQPPNTFNGKKEITIVRPIGSTNKSAFTHELLHAYLFVKGFRPLNTKKCFDHYKNKNLNFKAAYDGSPLDALYNAFQHPKMLPLFVDAGFEKENFRTDKEKQIDLADEYNSIQSKNPYQNYFINFIKFYSRVSDCPSDKFLSDYLVYKEKLNSYHGGLYNIFERHLNKWVIQDNYEFDDIYTSLLDDLEVEYLKNSA